MSKIKENYKESKNYSENIMNKVTEVLADSGIEYEMKSNGTEIVISDKNQSKDTVEKTVYDNIDIPKFVFMVLVDIVEVDDTIYIRQKTK